MGPVALTPGKPGRRAARQPLPRQAVQSAPDADRRTRGALPGRHSASVTWGGCQLGSPGPAEGDQILGARNAFFLAIAGWMRL